MAFQSRIGRAVLELSIDGGAFVRGAGDAKAVMRDLGRNIAQTQRQIQQQSFQFGGRQQAADAARMVSALERAGGVARLTATEKARVNAQLKEVIEKYQVLGKQAPAALIATERATRGTATASEFLNTKMVALGAAVGTFAGNVALRAVSGLAGMGREAFTSASRIVDLSRETGLAMGTIQEMSHVAKQGGKDLGSFTNASFQLTKTLGGGGDSVRAALADLQRQTGDSRLEWEKLRKATQDDQWNTVIRALSQVQDKNEQVRLGTELFGRTFRDVSGSVSDNYGRMADAARKSTDEQLLALDAASKAWEKFLSDVQQKTTATLGSVVLAFQEFGRTSWTDLLKVGVQGALTGGPMNAIGQVMTIRGTARAQAESKAREAAQARDRSQQQQNQTQADYVKQLAETEAELKKLDAAERKQIAAAKDLGADTEVLIDMLVRFGVSSKNADGALKLLTASTKSSGKAAKDTADEWQQMLDRYNGSQQRTLAANLARAIGSGQLDLAKMTDEAQQAIAQALEDGAAAWMRWGGIVPLEINRALAAVRTLPQMVEELNKLQQVPFGAGVPEGDAVFAQHTIDREFAEGSEVGTRLDAARDHNKALRDLDLQRQEFVIRHAERAGAKKADILRMESMLAQRQRDADLQDAEDAFDERTRMLSRETVDGAAEYNRRLQEYRDHVDKINQTWEQGEIERREEIRRESSFWASELGKRISGELRGIQHELTGRLVSTLFAGGDDEAKRRAKEAREHYEQLKASGTASAEAITRAFRDMRDAEEAAQSRFADRFKSIWDAIKRHLFNIFDSILEAFINNLLRGMLNAIMKSSIGQKLLGWIPGLGGGGGGGVIQDVVGGALGKVLGIGGGIATTAFSTTAGGTLAASMIAPGVASAAVPAAIASQGASAAVYGAAAGSAAAGAGGATAAGAGGAAAAGGGGLGATIAALATNPVTAVAAGALALWATGAFDAGIGGRLRMEAWQRGDRTGAGESDFLGRIHRDTFLAMTRPAPLATPALDRALSLPVYQSTQEMGMATLQRLQAAGGAQPAVAPAGPRTVIFEIKALDGADVEKVVRQKVAPQLKFMILTDQDGMGTAVRDRALD